MGLASARAKTDGVALPSLQRDGIGRCCKTGSQGNRVMDSPPDLARLLDGTLAPR
jgi:hypothetical protein